MTRQTKQEVASSVWELLLECSMLQAKKAMPHLIEMGLTPGHLKLLFTLDAGQAKPMGALAGHFGCDASTMTWLVDRLEEKQLVERRTLPEDRRVKAVALTAEGAALALTFKRRLYQAPPELAALDRATLESMREVFEKINANLA